jgi:RNA polymerase sigma factor (sigma-70 family)
VQTSLAQPFEGLLVAARCGDESAWVTLYRDLAPVLLGYLRAHGARDAEDLLGEVWIQVVRHIDRFEGDESGFRSWVFTIAHRRLIDGRRARLRRPEDLSPSEDIEPSLPATEAEPEALATLGTEEVVALLGRLTDDQREVLLLRLVGGLQLAEVAEATGRPRQAVKSLQKRGIEHLCRLVHT